MTDARDGRITGLHHVTAVTADARATRAFAGGALGLRLVKRTVNFDDPRMHHLYFGDAAGTPGTVITYFPIEGASRGQVGAGQVSLTHYAVPRGALPFWEARLSAHGARLLARERVFGEDRAVFEDADGLRIALVATDDPRTPWTTPGTGPDTAIRGLHGVTLALHDGAGAAAVLGQVFGWERVAAETSSTARTERWVAPGPAGIVDLHIDPALPEGIPGTGTVHHVAFRVPDGAAQRQVAARMAAAGLSVTPPRDRDYFVSVYARIPGGVLFEVATDGPGFTVDEPAGALGSALRLPRQHAADRARIEAALPDLGP